jgi:hypothetical protein
MNGKRFDRLAMEVGIPASRRQVLAGLGGAVLTVLLTSQGTLAARCAKKGQKPKRHKRCCDDLTPDEDGRCAPLSCPSRTVACDGTCKGGAGAACGIETQVADCCSGLCGGPAGCCPVCPNDCGCGILATGEAACFGPFLPDEPRCGPNGSCPPGQACSSGGRCVVICEPLA